MIGGGREVPPELDAPYLFVVEPRNGKKLPDKYPCVWIIEVFQDLFTRIDIII